MKKIAVEYEFIHISKPILQVIHMLKKNLLKTVNINI